MIKINDLKLIDIAAKSTLTDKTTKWIYESIDYALNKSHEKIMKKFWINIDELTEKELDFLLCEYHVDYIDEYTDTKDKRELIKKSIVAHFNKGTVGGLKSVCEIMFGNVEIKEWFEYGGNPGYFKISTSGKLKNEKDYLKVLNVVNKYKNERSWLELLRFSRIKESKINIGLYRNYKIKYDLGSTSISIPNENINTDFGMLHRSRYLIGIR